MVSKPSPPVQHKEHSSRRHLHLHPYIAAQLCSGVEHTEHNMKTHSAACWIIESQVLYEFTSHQTIGSDRRPQRTIPIWLTQWGGVMHLRVAGLVIWEVENNNGVLKFQGKTSRQTFLFFTLSQPMRYLYINPKYADEQYLWTYGRKEQVCTVESFFIKYIK